MARKIFVDGNVLPAQDVNAIANPIPDGTDFIGHGAKVIDNWLDDGNTQIKARFYTWYNRFKPSVVAGLELSVSSGVVNIAGTLISIPSQSVFLTDNANNYVYVGASATDSTIALRVLPSAPSFNHIPVASCVTVSSIITVVNDLRNMVAEYIAPERQTLINTGDCIFSFKTGTVPTGYLECLGQAVSRLTYSALFAALGTTYGVGDGSTTFNLPSVSDRVIKGSATAGTISGNANNSITLNSSQLPTHSHSIDDMPHNHGITQTPHNHGITQTPHGHTVNDAGHFHNLLGWLYDTDAGEGNNGDGSAYRPTANNTYATTSNISINGSNANITVNNATIGVSTNNTNTGITSTRNTGDSAAIDVSNRAISMRCFIKF